MYCINFAPYFYFDPREASREVDELNNFNFSNSSSRINIRSERATCYITEMVYQRF